MEENSGQSYENKPLGYNDAICAKQDDLLSCPPC